MPNMLQTGTAWLKGQLFNHAATSVTYIRGASQVALDVVRAETRATLNATYDLNIDVRFSDFLIKENDLVIPPDTDPSKPQRGDQILIAVDDEQVVYEVFPLGPESSYRESDRYGNVIRVHAKERSRSSGTSNLVDDLGGNLLVDALGGNQLVS